MSDLITPQELAALLQAFQENGPGTETVSQVRLSQSDPKLTPTQKLNSFLEDHAKHLQEVMAERLSQFLQLPVKTGSRFFHFVPFQELLEENGKWQSSLALRYSIPGWDKSALFMQETSLIYACVHALLGGGVLVAESARELTQLEWPVAELVSNELMHLFLAEWALENKGLSGEKIHRIASLQNEFSSQELVLLGLELELDHVRGGLYFVFPLSVLQAAHPDLFKENRGEVPPEVFEQLPLNIQAEIGPTRISKQELLEMQEGDVIKLDQPLRELLGVKVGGKKKFLAQPGVVEDHRALRIVKRVEEK
jgi:flagellar motor switch protein FliM